MKKLLALLFSIFLLSSPSVFAENFIYHCNLDTSYKNNSSDKWLNKYIKYTFSSNNNTVLIYDHEIDLIYHISLKIYSQNPFLIALQQDSYSFRSLVIDRANNYGTYAISYANGKTNGQYGIGQCNLQ